VKLIIINETDKYESDEIKAICSTT